MMTTSPFSYPSLQTVLEHMEPNLRISFSLHAPSIRFAEKATPMKIDNLQLDRTMIKINNTQYKLGVIRIYNGDDKPDQVKQDNSAGGLTYDLNEYGSRDYSCEYVLLPGDILIAEDREGDERSRVGERQYRRTILRGAMIRQGLEQDPENPLAVQNDEVYAQDCRIIESNQWSVLPHQLQEDGGVYPFENYLQLTMDTEGSESSKRIERVIYTKKLPEAMKHLLTMILGNRKANLHVENFKCANTGILRVPQGLKLTIRKMLVGNNLVKTLDALQPVMGSTFDTIEMTDREYTLEDIQHPAIKNAKKVILTCWCQGVDFMLDTLQGMRNYEVIWRRGIFNVGEALDFVIHMTESGREIGSSFSFGVSRQQFVELFLEVLLEEIAGARLATLEDQDECKMFPYVISIPIDESSEMNIFGEEIDEKTRIGKIRFNFKFQIMEIGTAKDSCYGFEEKMFFDLFGDY